MSSDYRDRPVYVGKVTRILDVSVTITAINRRTISYSAHADDASSDGWRAYLDSLSSDVSIVQDTDPATGATAAGATVTFSYRFNYELNVVAPPQD